MSLANIYRLVTIMARRDGWTVRECRVGSDAYGDIDVKARVIRIDQSQPLARKVTTLAHEYFGHGDQYEEVLWRARNKYVKVSKARLARIAKYRAYLLEFYEDTRYTPARMKIAEYCEIDASRRAANALIEMFPETLDMFALGKLQLEELNPEDLPWLRESWRESIFAK